MSECLEDGSCVVICFPLHRNLVTSGAKVVINRELLKFNSMVTEIKGKNGT